MLDKNGHQIEKDDLLWHDHGYFLILKKNKNGYYGKLVCGKNHSCKNMNYCIGSNEVTLMPKEMLVYLESVYECYTEYGDCGKI